MTGGKERQSIFKDWNIFLWIYHVCLFVGETFFLQVAQSNLSYVPPCHRRSKWPSSLRRRSGAARLLRSWVRIPPGSWISVGCECCVLSGTGLCDGLIIRPEESYPLLRVVVCDQETSKNEKAKDRNWAVKDTTQCVVTPGKQTNRPVTISVADVASRVTSIIGAVIWNSPALKLEVLLKALFISLLLCCLKNVYTCLCTNYHMPRNVSDLLEQLFPTGVPRYPGVPRTLPRGTARCRNNKCFIVEIFWGE